MRTIAKPENPTEDIWRDLQPLRDRELSRLPDKYRVPVALHRTQVLLSGSVNDLGRRPATSRSNSDKIHCFPRAEWYIIIRLLRF